jgi:hypothetical protein
MRGAVYAFLSSLVRYWDDESVREVLQALSPFLSRAAPRQFQYAPSTTMRVIDLVHRVALTGLAMVVVTMMAVMAVMVMVQRVCDHALRSHCPTRQVWGGGKGGDTATPPVCCRVACAPLGTHRCSCYTLPQGSCGW